MKIPKASSNEKYTKLGNAELCAILAKASSHKESLAVSILLCSVQCEIP